MLNQWETRTRQPVLKSRPYKVTIDPGNICNLQCKCCQTGTKHPEMPTGRMLRMDDFVMIFDQFKDYTLSVALYNFGEPLLNKQIFEMIQYATDHRVGTTIHSNLNLFSEEMAVRSVESGLTHVYLSIDGASQPVYEAYRKKGDLDRVLENLRTWVSVKKRMRSKFPIITWKYLVFDHNEHEVEEARRIATEIGVDSIEFFPGTPVPFDIYDQADYYQERPELLSSLDDQCRSLWSSVYINSNRGVYPCSLAYRETEAFGYLDQGSFDEIWNGQKYTSARSMFQSNCTDCDLPEPCGSCKYALKNEL